MKKLNLLIASLSVAACLQAALPVVSVSAFVVLGTADTAQAQRATRGDVNRARDKILERINTLQTEVVKALRSQTAEQSSHSNRQVEAQRRMIDAQIQNDTIRLRQQFRAEAESSGRFDPDPIACLLLDLSKDTGEGGASAPNSSRVAYSASNWLHGLNPAVQAGSTSMHRAILADRDKYKGYGGYERPTSDWASVFDGNSLDLAEMGPVYSRLISNTIDATPPRPLSAEEKKTPAGLAKEAERQGIDAVNSLAVEAASFALNARTAIAPSSVVSEFAKLSRYNRPLGEKISELKAIDVMTAFHYAPSPQERSNRNGLSEKALAARLYEVTSLQTRIDYLRLEHENRMLQIMAAILGRLNDQDSNMTATP